MSIIKDKI